MNHEDYTSDYLAHTLEESVFLFEEDVDRFIAAWDDGTEEIIISASLRPALFRALYTNGEKFGITHEHLAEEAGDAWVRGAKDWLTRDEWRNLFEIAGYQENDEPADRPDEPMMLYRKSPASLRGNWSWTDDLQDGLDFIKEPFSTDIDSQLWAAVVEPERLLSSVEVTMWHSDPNPGADNAFHAYVVDTTDLEILPYERISNAG